MAALGLFLSGSSLGVVATDLQFGNLSCGVTKLRIKASRRPFDVLNPVFDVDRNELA